jgi:hypothetical protein
MHPRRLLVGLIALFLAWTAPGTLWASPANELEPCGKVDLLYIPDHVSPGQIMEMQLTVWNCSDMFESLVVRARPAGPCRFLHPEDARYDLDAGLALTQFVTFIGPDCPGQYRVRVAVFVQGERLDGDRARFVVVEQGLPKV